MEGFSSECSSGCESGWTMYLDHSASPNPIKRCEEYKAKDVQDEEDDEEDLSMVSDASSGPPHLHEDEEYYYDEYGYFSSSSSSATALMARKSDKRQKIKFSSPRTQQSLLDDTASSPPVSNFPKSNFTHNNQQADISQGFSATHFQGRSAFQKHLGYLQSSIPGKPTSAKPVNSFDFLRVVCRKESGCRRRW